MDEKALTLFDAKAAGKKLLDSWAYILLALVMLLAVMSGYTDVSLDLMTAMNIGVEYAVLLLYCYVSMYALDSIAKKRGAEDKRYLDAFERVNAVRDRIKRFDGEKLQAFCDEYREAELICARKQILSEAMLSEKDFDKYIETKQIPKDIPFLQKVALMRAASCKPIKLNRYMIGRPLSARSHRDSFETPEQMIRKGRTFHVLTTAITVLFPVSLSLSVIIEPNLATLVEGLLKVFTIAFAGAKAYNGRLRNMVEAIPAYATLQEDIVDRFEEWMKSKSDHKSLNNSHITPP